LTSPYAPPDRAALLELERLVHHLMDELTAWRRRCQKAEADLQGLKTRGGAVPGDEAAGLKSRLLEIERENLDLHTRVERAREMVEQLQQRLVFLVDDDGGERAR
jgi:predicted  nucleic acid-binding Zn-ribbon protein